MAAKLLKPAPEVEEGFGLSQQPDSTDVIEKNTLLQQAPNHPG